jgi:ApbE superfamily uncharacterized protein (UPF0280 family)
LHLQHGPIDLIIGADGDRRVAFAAARDRFSTVLDELVGELPLLRKQVQPQSGLPVGKIARAMCLAVQPHAGFITPMAAVAGAVADEVLIAMRAATDLRRAYVNNGGDIALHLARGQSFTTAMAGPDGADLGRITVTDQIGGIATSGAGGRSLSRGIADAVTVLADSAAQADAAATLIANAVITDHPAIRRQPARDLDPDSDLGDRLVTVFCPPLPLSDIQTALDNGQRSADDMRQRGLIDAAALFLQGESRLSGQTGFTPSPSHRTLVHA